MIDNDDAQQVDDEPENDEPDAQENADALELNEEPENEPEPLETVTDPTSSPGFHVVTDDDRFLGTFQTENDAQAFIDGHVTPNGVKASIVTPQASAS